MHSGDHVEHRPPDHRRGDGVGRPPAQTSAGDEPWRWPTPARRRGRRSQHRQGGDEGVDREAPGGELADDGPDDRAGEGQEAQLLDGRSPHAPRPGATGALSSCITTGASSTSGPPRPPERRPMATATAKARPSHGGASRANVTASALGDLVVPGAGPTPRIDERSPRRGRRCRRGTTRRSSGRGRVGSTAGSFGGRRADLRGLDVDHVGSRYLRDGRAGSHAARMGLHGQRRHEPSPLHLLGFLGECKPSLLGGVEVRLHLAQLCAALGELGVVPSSGGLGQLRRRSDRGAWSGGRPPCRRPS